MIDRILNGAISLVGRVNIAPQPYLVLPLTVEPTKPRLCHDARYLNLWIQDKPFTLDKVRDLPRYIGKDQYQTIIDDKSGYDHLLLDDESRTYFGIQWGAWYFKYNTLPFGWKISPYVYQSTGLVATNFFRSRGVPCLLYIDDRHNGQLQVPLDKGAYASITEVDEKNLAAARAAVFIVCYYLVRLGYFLGLKKSILRPEKVVPYLGFLVDSVNQGFRLIPAKKEKFLDLVRSVLDCKTVHVKPLQRLVGKCVSFSLAVPAAMLITKVMNNAIVWGLRKGRLVAIKGDLQEEISHWLSLESRDSALPWREERHVRVTMATDASDYGWGFAGIHAPVQQYASDYWSPEEQRLDIATKEALAVEKLLRASQGQVTNARDDVLVDNMAVVNTWNIK